MKAHIYGGQSARGGWAMKPLPLQRFDVALLRAFDKLFSMATYHGRREPRRNP